jgi:hypothetical protein
LIETGPIGLFRPFQDTPEPGDLQNAWQIGASALTVTLRRRRSRRARDRPATSLPSRQKRGLDSALLLAALQVIPIEWKRAAD